MATYKITDWEQRDSKLLPYQIEFEGEEIKNTETAQRLFDEGTKLLQEVLKKIDQCPKVLRVHGQFNVMETRFFWESVHTSKIK